VSRKLNKASRRAQSASSGPFLLVSKMDCSVAILYQGYSKPVFVGITQDPRTLVLVKRQILKEARDALAAARDVGDDILIADVQGTLNKLEKTLDLLIPGEIEALFLTEDEKHSANQSGGH